MMEYLGWFWKNLSWEDQNLHTLNFLIISGLLQCFLLSIILFFTKHEKRKTNRFLALSIFIFSLHTSWVMVVDTNIDQHIPELAYIPFFSLLGLGPAMFFYVQSLTNIHFKIDKKVYWHFVPLIIEWGWQIIYGYLSIYLEVFDYFTNKFMILIALDWGLGLFSVFIYFNKSVLIIKNHQDWLLDHYSNLKPVTLGWLEDFFRLYTKFWMVWVFYIIFILVFLIFQMHFVLVYLGLYLLLIALTYSTIWLGLLGFRKSDSLAILDIKDEVIPEKPNKNFAHISDQLLKEYSNKLESLMKHDKLYLDEKLTLGKLAKKMGVSKNLLSYILNKGINKRFHSFVNSYRIEQVKQALKDEKLHHLTLLAIAYDAGFSSKASFNRIFKEFTGMTPKKYQDQFIIKTD